MTDAPCPDPEAHEAHMQMNGECPWCGATDPTRIRNYEDYDFQDADTLEPPERTRPAPATNYPRRGTDPIEDAHADEGERWTYKEHGW